MPAVGGEGPAMIEWVTGYRKFKQQLGRIFLKKFPNIRVRFSALLSLFLFYFFITFVRF